jgi:hypothetical protein
VGYNQPMTTNENREFRHFDASMAADSIDIVTDILSNKRRRLAVHALTDAPLTKETLVDRVAAHEFGDGPRSVSAEERKRVFVSLHQTHLPKLRRLDVLDQERDKISQGAQYRTVLNALDALEQEVGR